MRLNDVLATAGLIISFSIFSSIAYSVISIQCPGKDVQTIRSQTGESELSLILYYVSWCSKSRAAKRVYDEVAQFYHEQANFATINCWHLECNCSRTFPSSVGSKKGYPIKWPTLLVRYGRQIVVQYREEWNFYSLSRFLDNLFHPVLRLNSREELRMLNMRSNAVVLGLFPEASVNEYPKFVFAAVKWLENDPQKLVNFAVCLGPVAEDIVNGLGTTLPLIALLSDSDIEIFNTTKKWSANHIVLWLQAEVKRLSKNFVGYSSPQLLVDHIRKGTVLTIFADELQNSDKNFYTKMTNVMGTFSLNMLPQSKNEECLKFWQRFKVDDNKLSYAIRLKTELANNRKSKTQCKPKVLLSNSYTPYNELRQQYIKAYMKNFQPSTQLHSEDPNSAERLLSLFRHNECLRALISQNTPDLQIIIAKLLIKFIEKIAINSVSRHNRTMSVQILNVNKYRDMLHNLGVANLELSDTAASTVVLIVEPNQEGVYVMRKPFEHDVLLKFIKDYYNDNLYISRRSNCNAMTTVLRPTTSSLVVTTYSIHDINRQAFFNKIHHYSENTTTVLLLYTPSCAFSSLMSHVLVQVSVMLQKSQQSHNINIVRLNTQTNDLPWEFVTQRSPALIVLPRGHPDESRMFPANYKIDVRNVFGFLLAQLDPIDQVRAAFASCGLPTQKLLNCLHFTKTLAMQHIGQNLKFWQMFDKERDIILDRLKQFKDITLDIQERFRL